MNLSSFFAAEKMGGAVFYFEPESVVEEREKLACFYSDLEREKENIERLNPKTEQSIFSAMELAFSDLDKEMFCEKEQKEIFLCWLEEKYREKFGNHVKLLKVLVKRFIENKDEEVGQYVFKKCGFMIGTELFQVLYKLKGPISLIDCLEAWKEEKQCIRFLSQGTRKRLQDDVFSYFLEFSEEKLEEEVIRWFVQWISQEVKETREFESLVEKTKQRVESLRAKGLALHDVSVINYVLGNVRGYLCEKND